VRAFLVALLTPLARRLRGVDPNALTLVSVLAGVAAGGAFLLARWGPRYYTLAALLLAVSGVADSLDGIVARMYARTTTWGDFIDHSGDRLIEVAILSGIAFSPRADRTLGLYVLVVTLLHSYLGTQIEASFGNRRRDGPGKEELFVALIVFALVLAFFPELSFTVASRSVSVPDAFLAGLGLVTAAGLVQRVVRARRLGASKRSPE
jgi:archaetidylinositol phosphate synthase